VKPLRTRLQEARNRFGLPWEVLERDYILSWVLSGISRVEGLKDTLAFKGGSALKKCFFGEYRFSEDLDFSATAGAPRVESIEKAMQEACEIAEILLNEYAHIEIICERYTEKEPHPGGQEAFNIRVRFPWQRQVHTRIMVEISMDEKVLKPSDERLIIHGYGEFIDSRVRVYALEEIVAEKLRAILQQAEQFEKRGWSRSRARDYYDLWCVLKTYGNQMNMAGFNSFLLEKCAVRNVSFGGPDDFFQGRMLSYVEKTWEQWLGPLVPSLPPFETVIGELKPQIGSLIEGNH